MEEAGKIEKQNYSAGSADAEPFAKPSETEPAAAAESPEAGTDDDVRIYQPKSSAQGTEHPESGAESAVPEAPVPPADAAAPDPDHSAAAVIQNAMVAMDELDDARNARKEAAAALRKATEERDGIRKKVEETEQDRIRQARDELDTSFDEKLSACQNQIRETRQKRAEARENAVDERIRQETQPLDEKNAEIQAHVEQVYKESGIRRFAQNHFCVALFFPRTAGDWLMDLVLAVLFLFVVPLALCIVLNGRPVILASAFAAYAFAVFGVYLYVLHRYMIRTRDASLDAEQSKAEIRKNLKKKNEIAAGIRKSTDDSPYHLTEYDDRVASIENQMKEILADRREAIERFESETRDQLLEVVRVEFSAESEQKEQALAEAENADQQAEERLQKAKRQITDVYEPLFGKDLLNRGRLNELADYCAQNPSYPIEQAVESFRIGRK